MDKSLAARLGGWLECRLPGRLLEAAILIKNKNTTSMIVSFSVPSSHTDTLTDGQTTARSRLEA